VTSGSNRRERPSREIAAAESTAAIQNGLFVVASKGGFEHHPAWFHNLKANADTQMELRGKVIDVHASVIPEPERSELWPALVRFYPAYADYQRKTERVIPLVRLRPVT